MDTREGVGATAERIADSVSAVGCGSPDETFAPEIQVIDTFSAELGSTVDGDARTPCPDATERDRVDMKVAKGFPWRVKLTEIFSYFTIKKCQTLQMLSASSNSAA